MERRRAAFLVAPDEAARKQAAAAIQQRFYEFLPFSLSGQFFAPLAWRKSLNNFLEAPLPVFWSVEKAP